MSFWTVFQIIATIISVGSGIKSYQQAKKLERKGQDILIQKYGTGDNIPVVYGTRDVAGTVLLAETINNKELFVVYALCVGEVESVHDFKISGRSINDTSVYREGYELRYSSYYGHTQAEINAILGGSPPRMIFNVHKGGADNNTADPMLVGCVPGWTSAHKLKGITYLACHFEYDTKGMFNGLPEVTCTVQGKKLYDPRLDGTIPGGTGSHRQNDPSTWTFSENPPLAMLDYLSNSEYGKGIDYSKIALPTFQDSADDVTTAQTLTHTAKVVRITQATNEVRFDRNDIPSIVTFNKLKIGNVVTITSGSTTYATGRILAKTENTRRDSYDDAFRQANDEPFVYDPHLTITLAGGSVSTEIAQGSTTTTITATEIQKRFEINGVIDTNESVLDNVKSMSANMRGIFTYSGGLFSLKIEGAESVALSIDEDDILDNGITLQLENKGEKYNKVEIEFSNAQKNYETDTVVYTHTATTDASDYTSDDGYESLEANINFPYITNQAIATQHAKAILERSRNSRSISFRGTHKLLNVKVGELISVTNPGLNMSSEQYRITQMEINSDLTISVTAIIYQSSVYGYVTPLGEDIDIPGDPVDPFRVDPPSSLNFVSKNTSNGKQPHLTWNNSASYPADEFRLILKDSNSAVLFDGKTRNNSYNLTGILVANGYVAEVSSINSTGVESVSVTYNFNNATPPIDTPDLNDGSVTNVKIDTLSAGKINTGQLNLGTASGMAVRQAKTGYSSTATGFWLGNDGGTPKFNIGTSSNYFKFDGSSVAIAGSISATTGTIGGFQIGTTSIIDDADSFGLSSAVTAGDDVRFFAGDTLANKNIAPFKITEAGTLTATGATISGAFSAGTGNNIFKADTNGIYTGNSSFASAPFKVNASGSVQTTNSFTAGVTGTSNIAVMSGSDATYRFWSGNQSPTSANFSVDKTGKVVAQNLVLKLLDGTVFFDSSTGFTSSALSQISTTTGTKVTTISSTFDADAEYESVTVTDQTTVNVSVSLNSLFGGSGSSNQNEATAEANSEAEIPDNFTLVIQHSSNGGTSYSNLVSQQYTKVNTGTPSSTQYKITTNTDILYISGQGGIAFLSNSSVDIGSGSVDASGNTVLTHTGLVLTVSGASTTHRIKATVSTTDSGYDTSNKVTSTAPRVLATTDPSGTGFYVADGDGTQVAPSGDITRVQITTDSSSGLTGGANFLSGDALFTLGLASTIAGNKTFSNNVTIGGNLDVQGTTTTVNTDDLNVKDKNITLNYSTGDSSALSNGAGITIQDAVNSTTNATILWDKPNSRFKTSHGLNVGGSLTSGAITSSGVVTSASSVINTYLTLKTTDDQANNWVLYTNTNDSLEFNYNGAGNAEVVIANNGNATLTGVLTANAGVVVDNFTIDGTTIALSSGDMTLDVAGDIILDADGGDVQLRDGGTPMARLGLENGDLNIANIRQDYDIRFKGMDGNTNPFTALKLDMSEAGKATFSGAITSSGNLLIDSDNAEINLKSGVGTTSGAVNWTFNSTGTDFASIKLPYATRATKGLWIDSGYPITIDATTRIDFDIIGSTKMDLDGSGLSVAGSITSGTIIATSDNSYFRDNDNVGIYLQTTAQGTGNNDGVRLGLNGTHAFVWNYEAKPLAFATSGTERLSIGATGLFDFKANNITNITTYNGYIPSSSSSSTNSVVSLDSRNVNSSPSARNRGLYVDFKTQSVIGFTGSGTYAGVLTFRAYGNGTDLSGGYPIQIGYDEAGNLQTRIGSSATAWNSWKAIHVAGNNLTAGTISSGNINVTGTITGDDGLSIQGGAGNAYLQVGSNTGSWTWKNYQATHKLALEDSDGTGEVLNFDTSGNANFAGTISKIFDVGTAMTMSIDGSFGASGTGRYVTLGFSGTANGSNRIFAHNTGQDDIYIAPATSRGLAIRGGGATTNHFRFSDTGTLQVGNANTHIIDQSRNLFNIATISSGGITSSGFITGTRLRVGDGTDGYFYSDTAGRTAFRSGDFYIQDTVANYYNYATNQYHGASSGDSHYFRGNYLSGNSWSISVSGVITSTGYDVGSTTVIDSSRNLTNVNLVKFREHPASFYISPTNSNTLNAQYGSASDTADMWINYRGYADGFTKFRDLRIGNGKGGALLFVDGSNNKFDFQNGSVIQIAGSTVIDTARNLTNIENITSNGALNFGANSTSGRFDISVGNQTTSRGMVFSPYTTFGTRYSSWDTWIGQNARTAVGQQDSGIRLATGFTGAGASALNVGFYGLSYYSWSSSQLSGLSAGSDLTLGTAKFAITGGGDLQIGGTRVISASRNITAVQGNFTGTLQTGGSSATNSYDNAGHKLFFGGGNSDSQANYYIGTNFENFGGNYAKLDFVWHTGIRMGAQGVYGGIRFYSNEDLTTKLMSIGEGNGVTDVRVYNDLNVDSNIEINGTRILNQSRNLTNIATISSGDITTSTVYLNDTSTRLHEGAGNSLRITTGTGHIDIGSMNSGFIHFQGSLPYYFNQLLLFDANAEPYSTAGNRSLGSASRQWDHVYARGYFIGTTEVIDASRNFTSSQLYIGSWTPSNATSIGRIGKVTDRPAGSITNQLGTNANSVWEIVDYDWTVVLAKVTDAGNFTASGNVTAFSDQRLKTNIQTLDPKLALKMRGVSFTKDEKQGSGVIAQEIEKIAPELVLTADDEMGTKSVAYGNLVGYLIETVKDQQKQIDELKELIGAA